MSAHHFESVGPRNTYTGLTKELMGTTVLDVAKSMVDSGRSGKLYICWSCALGGVMVSRASCSCRDMPIRAIRPIKPRSSHWLQSPIPARYWRRIKNACGAMSGMAARILRMIACTYGFCWSTSVLSWSMAPTNSSGDAMCGSLIRQMIRCG